MNLAPWLSAVLNQLTQQSSNKNNPILLAGHDAKALLQVAFKFLANVLCEEPGASEACGYCAACQLLKSKNHPDVYFLFPQQELLEHDLHVSSKMGKKPSQSILIEEIRQCQNFFHTASSRQGKRYVVIYPFDSLNNASANALLKILEEPADNLRFLLIGQQADYLPATITSRCQKLTISQPSFQEQVKWLEQNEAEQAEQLLSLSLLNAYDALQLQYTKDLLDLRLKWVSWLVSADPYQTPAANLDKLGLNVLFELALRVCFDFQCIVVGQQPNQFPWLESTMRWVSRVPREQVNDVYATLQNENKFANHPLNTKLTLDFIIENWRLLKQ